MTLRIITLPVDNSLIANVYFDMVDNGVSHLSLDEGKGARRIIFVAIRDTAEIMIAMEGSGCLFVSAKSTTINKFKFITAGFNDLAASVAVLILDGLVHARNTNLDRSRIDRVRPQLAISTSTGA